MIKIKWAVWSGEGKCLTKEIQTETLQGIKRIAAKEQCGDRQAYVCPAHWPQAVYCSSASEFNINDCTENDMLQMRFAFNYFKHIGMDQTCSFYIITFNVGFHNFSIFNHLEGITIGNMLFPRIIRSRLAAGH